MRFVRAAGWSYHSSPMEHEADAPTQSFGDQTQDVHPLCGRERMIFILWLLSPTPIMLLATAVLGRSNDWIDYVFFMFGVLNLYAWSAVLLRRFRLKSWELKAIPLTGAAALVNIGLIFLFAWLLGI